MKSRSTFIVLAALALVLLWNFPLYSASKKAAKHGKVIRQIDNQ
jgi:hypothetical protein